MKIRILRVTDEGTLENERVVIRVLEDLDLGTYGIAKIRSNGTEIFSGTGLFFWFPDISVKKNDLAIIYSKSGKRATKINGNGNTSHFFYWGATEPIWVNNKSAAVLLDISDWSVTFLNAAADDEESDVEPTA